MSSITTTTSTSSNGTVTPSSTTSAAAPRSILRTSRKRSLETMDDGSRHSRGSANTTSASPHIMIDADGDHDGHRGVVWDESNLTLNDRFTALQSFQTVNEPKTPYHHYSPSRSESESDDVEAGGAQAANGRYWNHKRVHSEGSGGSGSSIHYSDDAYDPDDAAGSESENDRRRREEFENRRKNHYKQTAKPIVLHKLQDEPLEDEDIDDHSRDEEPNQAYNGHADDEEDDEDDDDDEKEETLRSSTRTQ